jgi:hypothetical protein
MNKKLFNMAKAKQRERAIDDGFYDGRFRTKVVEDKKKKAQRLSNKHNRNKNYFTDDDQ